MEFVAAIIALVMWYPIQPVGTHLPSTAPMVAERKYTTRGTMILRKGETPPIGVWYVKEEDENVSWNTSTTIVFNERSCHT